MVCYCLNQPFVNVTIRNVTKMSILLFYIYILTVCKVTSQAWNNMSAVIPVCPVLDIKNGTFVCRTKHCDNLRVGSVVSFMCEKDFRYFPSNETESTCQLSQDNVTALWDPSPGQCVQIGSAVLLKRNGISVTLEYFTMVALTTGLLGLVLFVLVGALVLRSMSNRNCPSHSPAHENHTQNRLLGRLFSAVRQTRYSERQRTAQGEDSGQFCSETAVRANGTLQRFVDLFVALSNRSVPAGAPLSTGICVHSKPLPAYMRQHRHDCRLLQTMQDFLCAQCVQRCVRATSPSIGSSLGLQTGQGTAANPTSHANQALENAPGDDLISQTASNEDALGAVCSSSGDFPPIDSISMLMLMHDQRATRFDEGVLSEHLTLDVDRSLAEYPAAAPPDCLSHGRNAEDRVALLQPPSYEEAIRVDNWSVVSGVLCAAAGLRSSARAVRAQSPQPSTAEAINHGIWLFLCDCGACDDLADTTVAVNSCEECDRHAKDPDFQHVTHLLRLATQRRMSGHEGGVGRSRNQTVGDNRSQAAAHTSVLGAPSGMYARARPRASFNLHQSSISLFHPRSYGMGQPGGRDADSISRHSVLTTNSAHLPSQQRGPGSRPGATASAAPVAPGAAAAVRPGRPQRQRVSVDALTMSDGTSVTVHTCDTQSQDSRNGSNPSLLSTRPLTGSLASEHHLGPVHLPDSMQACPRPVVMLPQLPSFSTLNSAYTSQNEFEPPPYKEDEDSHEEAAPPYTEQAFESDHRSPH